MLKVTLILVGDQTVSKVMRRGPRNAESSTDILLTMGPSREARLLKPHTYGGDYRKNEPASLLR